MNSINQNYEWGEYLLIIFQKSSFSMEVELCTHHTDSKQNILMVQN